jgi:hypothetical protein
MTSKIVVALVVLWALGTLIGDEESKQAGGSGRLSGHASQRESYSDSGPDSEITAAIVVDITPSLSGPKFCRSANMLGYDLALDSFKSGYGVATDPSAEDVFDEALSRC